MRCKLPLIRVICLDLPERGWEGRCEDAFHSTGYDWREPVFHRLLLTLAIIQWWTVRLEIILLHLLLQCNLKGPFITQLQLVAGLIFWYQRVQQPALLTGWSYDSSPSHILSLLWLLISQLGFFLSWIENLCLVDDAFHMSEIATDISILLYFSPFFDSITENIYIWIKSK